MEFKNLIKQSFDFAVFFFFSCIGSLAVENCKSLSSLTSIGHLLDARRQEESPKSAIPSTPAGFLDSVAEHLKCSVWSWGHSDLWVCVNLYCIGWNANRPAEKGDNEI